MRISSNKRHINIGAMAIFLVMALSWLPGYAAGDSDNVPAVDSVGRLMPRQDITVSLITCYPGPEIYELYGHTALRVHGEGIDSVWNFGVFDFRQPNFVYRFVKGETDYMVAGYPFEWFLPEYEERGSKVVEQVLNLTPNEANAIHKALQKNALPENRVYRYNYIRDNCATRPRDIIEQATGGPAIYPDTLLYRSFRDERRVYDRNYTWYQLGIDLALGMEIDKPLTVREQAFVPMELMRMVGEGTFPDGRHMVRQTHVLNYGKPDATLPPTPWWAKPIVYLTIICIAVIIMCLNNIVNVRITRWVYSLWFFVMGLLGCVMTFLVFISTHAATSPNILLIWFNPLQLIMAVCVWRRKMNGPALWMAWYNIVACAFFVVGWAFQPQSTHRAVCPVIVTTLVLAATYAIIAGRKSYNNK